MLESPEPFNVNPKPRLNLDQLYALYGYKPSVSNVASAEKKNLNLEWTPEQIRKMCEALNKVLDFSADKQYYQTTERVRFDNDVIFKTRFSKFVSSSVIELKIFDADGTEVAYFICDSEKIPNTWEVQHRLVKEEYRGQNIGSKFLDTLEEGIQHTADKSKQPQVLEIRRGELGAISFGLRNGYEFASEEDRANYELICSGNKSKILVTTVPDINYNGNKPGYVYSVASLQQLAKDKGLGNLNAEQIWNLDLSKLFGNNLAKYMGHSLIVVLKKEMNPQNSQNSAE